jgi:inosine-uridine nucleoside N-ribohydrolase
VRLDVGKVIIDTDAGADDAAVIFMAINSNKYSNNFSMEFIAITCVNGNTLVDNVVVNVLKTLQTANRLDVSSSYLLLLTLCIPHYFCEFR